MKYLRLLTISIIITLTHCKERPSQDFNSDTIIAEIQTMFKNYHDAIKKDGLTAEFDFLDDSDDFFWVPPAYKSALKYDSIKRILIENNKSIKQVSFEFETLEIFPLTRTIANYSGIVIGTMTDTSQVASVFKIIESGTLIKRLDGWKLLNGQSRNLE